MEDITTLITNVGFPIAVAIYLLIRVEGKLNQLTSAIYELREAIITMPHEKLNTIGIDAYRPVPTISDRQRLDN